MSGPEILHIPSSIQLINEVAATVPGAVNSTTRPLLSPHLEAIADMTIVLEDGSDSGEETVLKKIVVNTRGGENTEGKLSVRRGSLSLRSGGWLFKAVRLESPPGKTILVI